MTDNTYLTLNLRAMAWNALQASQLDYELPEYPWIIIDQLITDLHRLINISTPSSDKQATQLIALIKIMALWNDSIEKFKLVDNIPQKTEHDWQLTNFQK